MNLICECDKETFLLVSRNIPELNEAGRHIRESTFPVYVSKELNLERLLNLLKTPDSGILVFDADAKVVVDLLESGTAPNQIILCGTMEHSAKEHHAIRNSRIREFTMKTISFDGISDVCDSVMENANRFSALFLLVHLSVLDSACTKGGSPAGMSSRELVYFIQRLKNLRNLAAADFCGVTSEDAKLISKLVAECL